MRGRRAHAPPASFGAARRVAGVATPASRRLRPLRLLLPSIPPPPSCTVRHLVTSILTFYLVLPSFTGLISVLLGFSGLKRVLLDFTVFYWVLPSFIASLTWVFLGSYLVFLVLTWFYRVLLGFSGFTGFYWVLPGFTGFYRVLMGFTEFYRVLLYLTEFEWALLGFTGC